MITISGNLTNDPELRWTPSGVPGPGRRGAAGGVLQPSRRYLLVRPAG